MTKEDYAQLYKKLHDDNKNYGAGATAILPALRHVVGFLKPKSILDYGCGKGGLVRALQREYPDIKIRGYDPSVEQFNIFPTGETFDLVVNTDVLEHVPESYLKDTVAKIASLSKNVFFHLHHAKAVAVLSNGENAHCTIWTPQQYYTLFKEFFPVLTPLRGWLPPNTSCLTFDLPQEVKIAFETEMRLAEERWRDSRKKK